MLPRSGGEPLPEETPMTLRVGDVVADCTFFRPTGAPVRLSEFADRALVPIFLRHLA